MPRLTTPAPLTTTFHAIFRRTFQSGTNLLRTRYMRRRYPHLNHRFHAD